MDTTTLVAETAVQPRPYQQRIVAKAVDLFLNKGLRSVLIESPTGERQNRHGIARRPRLAGCPRCACRLGRHAALPASAGPRRE